MQSGVTGGKIHLHSNALESIKHQAPWIEHFRQWEIWGEICKSQSVLLEEVSTQDPEKEMDQ